MAEYVGKYTNTEEIRQVGLEPSMASDQRVEDCIKQAERLIEMWCGRWFYKRTGYTMTLDGGTKYYVLGGFGRTTELLQIPIPIITITAISIDGVAKTLSDFIICNRIGPPNDDRWNPRIYSKNIEWPCEGIQNIVLTGDFGFVEDAALGTVPEDIKRIARKLTIRLADIKKLVGSEASAREMERNSSWITHEKLPGYEYDMTTKRYGGKGINSDIPIYTGDNEIDQEIDRYRYKTFTRAI